MWLTNVKGGKACEMKELRMEEAVKTPQGGGGSGRPKRRRQKRTLREESRCLGRLPDGRRCEAARLRHSLYCVFHDPEMAERRLRLGEPIPYAHPDEVQRLLGEVVEAVKKGKLTAKKGNTLGYLATLLLQNQAQVKREKDRVEDAQYTAEMQAGIHEVMLERAEGRAKAAEEG